ncbi:MAG: isomerizing glutamine--fructose-6-phosphate transaminase [Clostridiaceae bacterium]|jgi:glucosamine--fructose-6-phosphate aminotransferase (isomerizing)|nr:isomerizing glutamine--fructose-6-phosphate transaminase [Clostridiaceae bacterium]
MCGIIGYIGKEDATSAVIAALKRMEYRGYDSAGYAVLDGAGRLTLEKDNVRVGKLKRLDIGARIGIGHTRWATHGKPSKNNAHPHVSYDGNFAVVHNGIIENGDKLKSGPLKHVAFASETDSEVIAHLIAAEYARIRGDRESRSAPTESLSPAEYARTCGAKTHGGEAERAQNNRVCVCGIAAECANNVEYEKIRSDRESLCAPITDLPPAEYAHNAGYANIAGNNENISADILKAVENCIGYLRGAYSFAVMSPLTPDTLYCCRKGASLIIGLGDGENVIASDMLAAAAHSKFGYVTEDGEIAKVTSESAEIFSDGAKIFKPLTEIINQGADFDAECFMRAEIAYIPQALRRTAAEIISSLKNCGTEFFRGINGVFLSACGTAYHAGLYGKRVFQDIAGLPAQAEIASEAVREVRFLNARTLAVFISQSGETADTLNALRAAKERGARTLAITNVRGSSISFIADKTLYLDCGAEIAVAATKSYNSQLLALYLVALHVKSLSYYGCYDLSAELEALYTAAEATAAASYSELFKGLENGRNFFFIGRGLDYVNAGEGALKLKEITYRMTDAYPAGELKHGTIALIDQHALIVAVLTDDNERVKIMNSIAELKSRSATVMLVTSLEGIKADLTLKIPDAGAYLTPIISVIPLQKLALYVAEALGLDPDKPRNLAKSVTVE